MPARLASAAVLSLAAAAALSGCGSASSTSTSTAGGAAVHHPLSAASAQAIQAKLADAQAAAGHGDRAGAITDINAAQALITTAATDGQITATVRAALLTGLNRSRQQVIRTVPVKSVRPATSTPTTASSTPAPPAPQPPGQAKKHDHGHGNGNENGQGGGGDGGD